VCSPPCRLVNLLCAELQTSRHVTSGKDISKRERRGKRMKCPFCDHSGTKVLDSRSANENKSIRRRRECEKCARRFTTFEMVEETPLIVIKKDGSREEFSREKILRGLIRACE